MNRRDILFLAAGALLGVVAEASVLVLTVPPFIARYDERLVQMEARLDRVIDLITDYR